MPRVNITSLQNHKLKELIKLKDRSKRNKEALTVVEGFKEISAAFEAGNTFDALFACAHLLTKEARAFVQLLERQNVIIYEAPLKIFDKASYADKQEGLIAICKIPRKTLNDLVLHKNPLLLVVEHVEKPGNLGALIRTADAAGIDGVIVCDPKTDVYNPNVIRASTGAVFTTQVIATEKEDLLNYLKQNQIQVASATPEAKNLYTAVNWKKSSAVVVGAEHEGLSDFWKKNADCHMTIPLFGKTDSLNVSVSAAVILYEAIRQRSQ